MNDRNSLREKEKSIVHKTKYQEEKMEAEPGLTSLGLLCLSFSLVLLLASASLKRVQHESFD